MEQKSGVIHAKNSNSKFGKKGWAIIIFGMIMYFSGAAILMEGSNVILPALNADRGMSVATLYSLNTVASLICIPVTFVIGIAMTKKGSTKLMGLCWLAGAIGCVVISLSPNYAVYTIGRILVYLVNAAGVQMCYNTLIANWFPTKKDLAQGWATIGSNLSTALSLILLTGLIAAMSIRNTLFVFGVVYLVIAIICFACVKDNPEDAGCFPDNDTTMTREKALELKKTGEEYAKTSPWTIGKLFRTKQTWQIAVGYGIILLITVGILSTFVATLTIKGLESNTSIYMMTVAAVIGIPCSYLWGFLASKTSTKKASLVLYGIIFLCLIFVLIPGKASAYVSVILLGCFIGAGNNLTPSIIASVFGRYDFSRAMTVILPLWNIVLAFAPTVVGVPQSLTGSYTISYVALIVIAAVGFILVLTLSERCIGRKDLVEEENMETH